jgi:hypothetical protein
VVNTWSIRGGLGRCRMESKVLEMLVEGRKERQRPRTLFLLTCLLFFSSHHCLVTRVTRKRHANFVTEDLKFIECFYFYTSSADFNGIFKNGDTFIAPGLPGYFREAKYSIKINSQFDVINNYGFHCIF